MPFALTRSAANTALVWALALLFALQGLACAVLVTLGPAHVHDAAAGSAGMRYGGFQLWAPLGPQAPAADKHVFGALGHFHASADAQRHHHAAGDASVAFTNPADVAGNGDADEGPGLPGFMLALLPAVAPAYVAASGTAPAWRPLWACASGFASRLERPPQAA